MSGKALCKELGARYSTVAEESSGNVAHVGIYSRVVARLEIIKKHDSNLRFCATALGAVAVFQNWRKSKTVQDSGAHASHLFKSCHIDRSARFQLSNAPR